MYERSCVGCNNPFTTHVFRQRRCHKNCGRSKASTTAFHFVGVDGEGVDRPDGQHEYVMLSVGPKTLFKEGIKLDTQSIFTFLYDCFRDDPTAVYVGFFLGYDFIQWERGLPEERAYSLLAGRGIQRRTTSVRGGSPYPDAVVWNGWEFDILAGRRWKLRPHVHQQSRYYRTCRNRTCDFEFTTNPELTGFDAIDAPCWLPDGEMLFDPSSGVYGREDYDGLDIGDFWHRYSVLGVSTPVPAAPNRHAWMYICDTGPFWQASFLSVIDPSKWDVPVCSTEEYAVIVEGKQNRGIVAADGDVSYWEDMVRYNVLENDILARVTERLDAGFRNEHITIRIKPHDWYGPGRAAQTWMEMLSDKLADPVAVEHNKTMRRNPNAGLERRNEYTLRNIDVYADMPEWAQMAARRTYYGGWFEQMVHGHVGVVWEYDINSAYPYVIANLPCLHTTGPHNGRWSQGGPDNVIPDGLSILHVRVTGSNPYIGAMPFRNMKGNISRPNLIEGWYWRHELEASMRAGLTDYWEVIEWVALEPCQCSPPFNPEDIGIERMYDLRLQAGKNTPQGKGFKLVYNSAYGKTAQSIGNPKYSNPLYASLITAGCRTQILGAIALHPVGAAAVSMVATDGVYFTSPHPGLELSSTTLGLWDETVKVDLTQLMPGVYWDAEVRQKVKRGDSPGLKSRGVNAKDLARRISALDYAFDGLGGDVRKGVDVQWPVLDLTVDFLLDSAKSALSRGDWTQAGRVRHGTTRRIDTSPHTKRDASTTYLDDDQRIRTLPYKGDHALPSLDYHKTFGYVEWTAAQDLFGDMISPDGPDGMSWFRELLGQ